ncbi:MAG: phytoene desaturase family protein [Gaiellales bacterium]
MSGYDAIVVGGGHNGLVAAGYLARARKRVCVLERRDVLGGACVTEELWPGYRVSRCSYVVSLLHPAVVRDLELPRHGYRVRICDPNWVTITPDGQPVTFWYQQPDRTLRDIAAVSRHDAGAWPRYENLLDRVAGVIRPLLTLEPPPGDLGRMLAVAARTWGFRRRDVRDTYRLLTMSVADLLDDFFESEPLKGSFASSGVVGVWAGPCTPGTAYNLLHHSVGEVDGVPGAWGQAEGGMGAISTAIARSAQAAGAVVRTGANVASVDIAGGRVLGVTLRDGETLRAPVVVSGVHPRTLVLDLVERRHWPAEVVTDVERFRTRGGAVKINLVVSELPRFTGIGDDQYPGIYAGEFGFCRSIGSLERSWDEAKHGTPSQEPYLDLLCPSVHDPTLVDPGLPGHVMTLYTQFGPFAEESWPEGAREAYADRCMEILRRYAPNMTDDTILHREILAPPDMERIFGLLGGNIFHGEQGLDQMAFMRPAPALARYATPIAGLYLCGSGSHPGGGVTGLPGHNAARRILEDEPLIERLRRRARLPRRV